MSVPLLEVEDLTVLPRKIRGAKDHMRYRGAADEHDDIPEGHNLCHLPAHPKCPVCRDVKL